MRIILASKSPRRRELLSRVTKEFEILPAEADETLDEGTHPKTGVEILARRKGDASAARAADDGALILSSDTLVELDGEALGKPTDEEDAFRMLRALSGRAHHVYTGVAVRFGGRIASGVAESTVRFRPLSDEEIRTYIATGEPMDKAGAYGIQGLGGKLVAGYDGDFDTIMGLSLALVKKLCEEVGAAGAFDFSAIGG